MLKEDVAGLYDTSWEPFVQGSSARQIQRFHARQKLVEKLHVFERGLHAKIIKAELWRIEGAKNDLFIIRDLVLDLGIVVKDHQLHKAAAYEIGDSETSKKAWQALFASLQSKLLQRLKNAQSYCKLSEAPHGNSSRCQCCKCNYEFLVSQADAPDVSHEAT